MTAKEVINPEDNLLGRIPINPDFIKENGVLSSTCFDLKKNENGVSVDLERLTSPEITVKDKSRYYVYALKASSTTDLGLTNVHNPLPDNYAHCLICGNFTKSIRRALAKKASKVL